MKSIVSTIIIIFLIIFLWNIWNIRNIEHLTAQSDEAIQNLASLYNKDQLTIANLSVTKNATSENSTINDLTAKKASVTGTLSGPTIQSILNRLNALEGKTKHISADGSNVVRKNVKFRMRNYGRGASGTSGGYGPWLYSGNHNQVLWRDPNTHSTTWHTPDRFEFSIH